MADMILPPSPQWYSSQAVDANRRGYVVIAARHKVYVLDATVTPPAHKVTCSLHTERVSSVMLGCAPQIEYLCASGADDGKIKIWDIRNPKEVLHDHEYHTAKVMSIAWSTLQPDILVSASENGTIVCWQYLNKRYTSFCPENSTVSCMKISPLDENILAVGYKGGCILILDIQRDGSIKHKLRGHDEDVQSLTWCPVSGEYLKTKKEEYDDLDNPGQPSGTSERDLADVPSDFGSEGHLLASGSKDKTIRIWSTSSGRQIIITKLPKPSGLFGKDLYIARSNVWVAVVWSKTNPCHVICSSYNGEVLQLDLSVSGPQKWQYFTSSDRKKVHNRLVFNLNILGPDDNILCSYSMDRNLILWDINDRSAITSLPTIGGFVYVIKSSVIDPGRLALGVGDNTIRVWNLNNPDNIYDITTLWQGIKAKVTALSWHPKKENLLAYGTDDGRVGIYDTLTNKPPSISSHYHRKTVYVVSWGPKVDEHRDGRILSHDPHKLTNEAVNVIDIIEEKNGRKQRQPIRSEISWSPDFSLVAIGNDDGSVEIYHAPSMKRVCTIHIHNKLVNSIQWHPHHTTDSPIESPYKYFMATGSNEATIQIVDLSSVVENIDDNAESVLITQPKISLFGHYNRIINVQWSPHNDQLLASVSFDGTARVWDISNAQMVACYHGHKGKLYCVLWSGFETEKIYTGGDDFTVQKWSYKEHPPSEDNREEKKRRRGKNRKKIQTEEITSEDQSENKKNGLILRSEDQDAIDVLLEKKKQEILAQSSTGDSSSHNDPQNSSDPSEDQKVEVADDVTSSNQHEVSLKSSVSTEIKTKSEKINSVKESKKGKKWKVKSLFPLYGRHDSRCREEILGDLEKLAWIIYELQGADEGTVEDFWSTFDAKQSVGLGFFIKDRRAVFQCLELEGQYHRDHDNMEYYYQLEIWKGNINGALRLAREREELSDWLVAMAPMAAFDTWIMTCQDYAVQLESEGLYHKAATYLLAAHKVYDAIELFKRHRLFKEAIALAKVRLSPFDPVLEDLYMLWAHQLTNDGNYEQAAKCHLAMRQVKDAALLLARRYNCQSSLKTAARISLVASEKQQGMIYAYKIMQQHLLKYEWMEAYQFLKEQRLFQVLLAVSGMHELVSKELNKSENPSFTKIDQSYFTNWNSLSESKIIIPDFILDSEDSDAVSPWKPWLTEGHTFPHRVLRVWYSHLSIAMDTENIEEMYKSLSVLHAGKQTQVQLSQLLLQVSVDLVLCLLSLLMSETPTAISHLLHGVSCLHQAGHFKVMETILRIFLPQGPKYMLKLQQEITAMRVVISMESRSDFDGASKVHTIKRYMSELKEEDSMSCGGIRCRELDCLRAYYYLAILYFLKEEFNIEKAQNVKMDKPIAEVAPNVRRNNNTNYTEGQTNSQSDQINTHSDTNLKAVPSNPPSAAVMDVASATVMDVASATVMDVARDEENQIETSTTYQIKRHELDKNSEECIGKSASLVVTGNFLERENSHTLVLSEEGPPINVYLAKNAESSMKEVNSSSKLENNSVKDLHEEKLSNEMTLDSKDGSSVDGIHTPDACVKRKPKDCQQTENEVQNAEDVSLPDQNDNQKEKTSLKEKLATKTPSVSSMNVSYTLTYAKLSHLSRGLVWDIQGKRYALMETLGYIHKAISQLLLAQKPLSTTQTETVQSPAEDHEYSSQISQEITSFRDSNESLPEHFHEHEHLSHLMTHLSCHGDKKRHNSDPVPPLLSGPEGPSTHDNSNQGHRIARSVSSDSHSLDFHVQHDDHVCGSHGNSDLSDSDPLDLCTSCEWLNKSRKVLWKDEPVNQLGVENTGKGNMMSIINPAKYINTPDEWYHMSADQKYSKPYVTMAILKEEQEYMMNELKRGPDAIQAPFPNPIDSVKLLLDICHSNDVLTAAEKKQFTENAVTWALKFTVSTQQKDALMELMHKMLTH